MGTIEPMPLPNALFAVFGVSDADAINRRLPTLAPWPTILVGNGEWFIVAPSGTTTKELSERLGIGTADSDTSGFVVRVDGYFGRAATSIWEWIATKTGAELGTSAIS